MVRLAETNCKGVNALTQKRKVEDYMRVVYLLLEKRGAARGADLARHFGVSKPTVSASLKTLTSEGYLYQLPDHSVVLTKKGMEIAKHITERNNSIYQLLTDLGVNEDIAAEDACNLEHIISSESYEALLDLARKNSRSA